MDGHRPGTDAFDWTEERRILGRRVYVWQINFWSLLGTLFVTFIGFYFSSPFLPLLVQSMGVTDPAEAAIWSGFLLGVGPMVGIFASPIWGRIADQVGGRVMLSRTVIGFAVANGLMSIATDLTQLTALRIGMGLVGGFTAVAMAQASVATPPERATRSMGLVQSTQIMSLMIAPALGGLMADRFGIRAAFLMASGLACLAGLTMMLLYREPAALERARRKRQATGSKVSLRTVLSTPFLLPLILILFAGNFADRTFQALIPLFIQELNPDSTATASLTGFIIAAGALAATFSANAAGRLVQHHTHARVLFVALMGGALGCGLMALSQSPLQFGLLRTAAGLFTGGILTLAYGLGGLLIPIHYRARAFTILNIGFIVGSAVSPMLGGALAAFSLRGAFVFNALILLFGALVAWFGLGFRRMAEDFAAPVDEPDDDRAGSEAG